MFLLVLLCLLCTACNMFRNKAVHGVVQCFLEEDERRSKATVSVSHRMPQRRKEPNAKQQHPCLRRLSQRRKKPKAKQHPCLCRLSQRRKEPKAKPECLRLHRLSQRRKKPKAPSASPHRPSPNQNSLNQ